VALATLSPASGQNQYDLILTVPFSAFSIAQDASENYTSQLDVNEGRLIVTYHSLDELDGILAHIQ
jgi:hypothetical protein